MKADLLHTHPVKCTVCTNPVPENRLGRAAVTCSKECAKTRRDVLRARQDLAVCRYCNRPSTLAQRALFSAWKRLQVKATKTTPLEGFVSALRSPTDEAMRFVSGLTAKDRRAVADLLSALTAQQVEQVEQADEADEEEDEDDE